MIKVAKFFLLFVFCFTLQGCPYFPKEDYLSVSPILEICRFNDSCEMYHDNAWIKDYNDPRPWTWLQKPYPLGGGYYMWTLSERFFCPENVLFLSTTREEWNAGNHNVDDSLVICTSPYTEDYIFIRKYQEDIVKDYFTIEENQAISSPHNKYITWADTAWFRKNVLEKYNSNPNHSVFL